MPEPPPPQANPPAHENALSGPPQEQGFFSAAAAWPTAAASVRRLARGAALLAAAACANPQAPPGGPEDKAAPELIATRPDTMARLQGWTGPVVFVFDEELAEQGVEEAVSLSPVRGRVAVDKEGDQIVVRPRAGWERGQVYQAEVAAGIKDRFGNARTEPVRLVFSTGPDIPDTRASGTVVERLTGNPGEQTRVDAVRLPDSLTYTTRTDSAGRFALRQIPEGEYRLVAYRDANRNGRPDPFEARDTARLTIAVGQAPSVELATLLPDSTPPVVRSATLTRGWVEVGFDDYLDPEQPLSPAQVAVIGPGGLPVVLAEVRIGAPPAAAGEGARADSAAPAPGQGTPRPGTERPPRADTAQPAAPRRPLPAQTLVARPAAELLPDTVYAVRVTTVRNVSGLVGGGEARLRTPEPAPRPRPGADSSAADAGPPPRPGTARPVSPRPPAPPTPGRPRAALPGRGGRLPARD